MSKFFLIIFGISVIAICSSCLSSSFSKDRKIVFKLCGEFSGKYKKKYGLRSSAISEAAPEGKYENLGMDFFIDRKLSKDEGRKILLELGADFLHKINHSKSLEPFLLMHPFKGRNIVINIFVQLKKGPDIVHPEIGTFSIYNDELRYFTYPSDYYQGGKIRSIEVETLEEAQRIVEEQKTSNNG